jgi:hypothetical protein
VLFHAKAANTFAYRTAELFILHRQPLMFWAKLFFSVYCPTARPVISVCCYITGTRGLPASNNSINFVTFFATMYNMVFSVTSLRSFIIQFLFFWGGGHRGRKITANFLLCKTPIALALHAENLSHCSFNNTHTTQ